jgi:mannose-1-phosphate guanylyltransferase
MAVLNSLYPIIMAGGTGTRFWPKSRFNHPKFLLNLTHRNQSMLALTLSRFINWLPTTQIRIISYRHLQDPILETYPDLSPDQLILEPNGKDTLAAILLTAYKMKKQFGSEFTLGFFPTDHHISPTSRFREIIQVGVNLIHENPSIPVALGTIPTEPNPALGYILHDSDPLRQITSSSLTKPINVYTMKGFREKPSPETASHYLNEGNVHWNIGIYLWNVETLIQHCEQSVPQDTALFESIEAYLNTSHEYTYLEQIFPQLTPGSIEFAVIEHLPALHMLECDFQWDDLGTWDSVEKYLPKDEVGCVLAKDMIAFDSKNLLVNAPDSSVVAMGIQDLVLVQESEILFICHRSQLGQIKEIHRLLHHRGRHDLL